MNAPRELAQRLQRSLEIARRRIQQRSRLGGRALHPRACQPQGERQRHELLLRPVVQVALDRPPLPRPAVLTIRARDARSSLTLARSSAARPLVLERQCGSARDRVEQLALLGQGCIVHRSARVLDGRRDPPFAQRERCAVGVHEPGRRPVRQLQ
jgi:hypothetical protein